MTGGSSDDDESAGSGGNDDGDDGDDDDDDDDDEGACAGGGNDAEGADAVAIWSNDDFCDEVSRAVRASCTMRSISLIARTLG